MVKPILFAVDDDTIVLHAVERDLRRRYGREYRIMGAASGTDALKALRQLKVKGQPVALFLVDQRMPQMTGIAFLEEATKLFPEARRVLLTAYADTEVAIRAINEVRLDYYLMKPWDPPEEHLYPVLDELLEEWQAAFTPPFEGIRVVGHRWSPVTYQLKDFLARNMVPYQWLDVESDEEAQRIITAAGTEAPDLPLVLFSDQTHLIKPTPSQVAEKIGLRTRAVLPLYDLIIVGAGPAGLAAAVYAASEGLKTLLVEKEAPGGQAGLSSRIENYLGFHSGVSGSELARRAVIQATRFGAEILRPQEVASLRTEHPYRIIRLADDTELNTRALLISTGVSYRRLQLEGADDLTGAGIYYGSAATEARGMSGKDVFIVGGGNSAGQGAMHLSRFARSVTMLLRSSSLAATMSRYLIDQIEATENITISPWSEVTAVGGKAHLETLSIANSRTGDVSQVPADALFVFIGAVPHTDWAAGVVERDRHGFILSGPDLPRNTTATAGGSVRRNPAYLETSVPGVFVAGDVRHQSIKRVASAVGEGAMAVAFVHQYLATL